ncbi:MAG: hypothetical protein FJW27_16170 [Acidimicrobiia bacterium]|nr:hypothetical protein [Acidimicrobiia bacterium]
MRIRLAQTLLVVVGLLALALGTSALAQGNSTVGNWRLNLAKSKYSPGPPPKSTTIKIEPAGLGRVITTVDAVAADGTKQRWTYAGGYDGKDSPIMGNNPNGDTVSRKRVNLSTTEATFKKAGKVTVVNTVVVSADGKTLTVTAKGTDPQGRAVDNLQVYDRQP